MPSAFSLPKMYEQEIQGVIDAGYYSNKSEVVRDALRSFFESKEQLRIAAAIEMLKKDEITLSKAAEISGLNLFQFKEIIHDRGINTSTPTESKNEIKRGAQLLKR